MTPKPNNELDEAFLHHFGINTERYVDDEGIERVIPSDVLVPEIPTDWEELPGYELSAVHLLALGEDDSLIETDESMQVIQERDGEEGPVKYRLTYVKVAPDETS